MTIHVIVAQQFVYLRDLNALTSFIASVGGWRLSSPTHLHQPYFKESGCLTHATISVRARMISNLFSDKSWFEGGLTCMGSDMIFDVINNNKIVPVTIRFDN